MSDEHHPRARPASASELDAAPDELATLQGALLRATLRAEPLPGDTPPPALPDLRFLPASGPAPLAPDHLAPGALAALDDLAREAREGDRAFLRFRAPRREGGTLWLTLEVVLRDAGVAGPQPLGGVQVGFARSGTGWRTADAPRAYAT